MAFEMLAVIARFIFSVFAAIQTRLFSIESHGCKSCHFHCRAQPSKRWIKCLDRSHS